MPPAQEPASIEQLMAGVLAMLVADREDRLAARDGRSIESRRTELILAGAGFTYQQIGALLDKKPDTVKKAISRARSKSTQNTNDNA